MHRDRSGRSCAAWAGAAVVLGLAGIPPVLAQGGAAATRSFPSLAAIIAADVALWSRIVRETGATVD
jgi:hypothetical protein